MLTTGVEELLAGTEVLLAGLELVGVEDDAAEEEAAAEEPPVPPQAAKAVAARTPKTKLVSLVLLTIKFTLLSKLVRTPHSK